MAVDDIRPQRLARITDGYLAFVRSPGRDAAFPVRTSLPRLHLAAPDTEAARLEWTSGEQALSGPLDGCLWAFLDLATTTDEAILAFARQHGVLSRARSSPSVPERERHAESLALWRELARSMGAVLDLATAIDQGKEVPHGAWAEPFGMLQVTAHLNAGKTGTWMEGPGAALLATLDVEVPRLPAEELLSLIVSEFLQDAHVAWVPPVGGMRSNRVDGCRPLTLTLPADGFVSPTNHHPAISLAGMAPGSIDLWRVDSLLPVLAAELVFATEPGWPGAFYPCSRCGRRARVIERRPGSRKAWFGDHEYCRQRHRAEVKLVHQRRTAEQRNAARRAERARARTATEGKKV